jgi:2-hydroxychromene-2-carboxylate isomerase
MGEVIVLGDWIGARRLAPQFIYDLACPLSYLAAEQVEASLGEVDWIPARASDLDAIEPEAVRAEATRQAHALHLPLVWPERYPEPFPRAARAAAAAAADGHGAQFGLAALRLAFCGGFDLEEPEILFEAAAAAGIGVNECLEAAEDEAWDAVVAQTALELARERVARLPAIRMGRHVFGGPQALAQAWALLDAQSA